MPDSARRQRWLDAEVIAGMLGITKNQVYTYLMSDITEKGWLQEILNGNQEFVSKIKELPGWQRLQDSKNEPKPRVYKPKDQDTADTPEDQIRVAMWFIRKIGTPEQAMEAVRVAAQAMEKLGKKQR